MNTLLDGISCVGAHLNADLFLKKSYEERMNHTKWINNEIRRITPKCLKKRCYRGYCGPWIEDRWLSMEKESYSTFGPFIPLFVPWIFMWTTYLYKNFTKYILWRDSIFLLMSNDYFYVTLSLNSDGIEGQNEVKNIIPRNLLILSGGGKGHIPIFIFMKERNPKDFKINKNYKYDLMFVGKKKTHLIRKIMIDNYTKFLGHKFKFYIFTGIIPINWKNKYINSKFILSPRGYGRNSFRLSEILQSGMVPVYIYDDIIWLPYYDSINWSSVSIVTNVSQINQTIDRIRNTTPSDIVKMRKKIISMYDSHFSEKGLFNHIKLFLLYGFSRSDLRCAKFSYYR